MAIFALTARPVEMIYSFTALPQGVWYYRDWRRDQEEGVCPPVANKCGYSQALTAWRNDSYINMVLPPEAAPARSLPSEAKKAPRALPKCLQRQPSTPTRTR